MPKEQALDSSCFATLASSALASTRSLAASLQVRVQFFRALRLAGLNSINVPHASACCVICNLTVWSKSGLIQADTELNRKLCSVTAAIPATGWPGNRFIIQSARLWPFIQDNCAVALAACGTSLID